MIGLRFRDGAHLPSLAAVPVTTTPEDDDEPTARGGTHRTERAVERVRRVRVIAQDRGLVQQHARGGREPAVLTTVVRR